MWRARIWLMFFRTASCSPRAAIVTILIAGATAGVFSQGVSERIVTVKVPARPDAGMYSLTAGPTGTAYLSWLEPATSGLALRFASLERGAWSAPRTIVEGRDLFSNWADHPSLEAMANGSLVAQWPVVNPGKTVPGTYNNSIRIAVSRDRGATWTEALADGKDNVHSYSGFVSLLPGRTAFDAVYLTPPRPISHDPADHRMTLSTASVDASGKASGPHVLDPDTCSCCPTAIAMTSEGPIAAYRDHEPGEIRDIAIVRLLQGKWTAPRPVHRDGWKINGCPTNGPELSANGRDVAAAWFTAAGDVPRMKVAFSSDAGGSFATPTVVDDGGPVGRGALVMLPDRAVAVAWLEATGNGAGEVRLRRVTPTGQPGKTITVGAASPGRTTGMMQMIRLDTALLLAWRGEQTLVTALVPLSLL